MRKNKGEKSKNGDKDNKDKDKENKRSAGNNSEENRDSNSKWKRKGRLSNKQKKRDLNWPNSTTPPNYLNLILTQKQVKQLLDKGFSYTERRIKALFPKSSKKNRV